MTPAQLNALANHPEIMPHVAPGHYQIDMAGFFANPRHIAIGDDKGAVIFAYLGKGRYEMHYLLTPALRGQAALARIRAALATLFTDHGAQAIVGDTPDSNRAARAVNRALGGTPTARTTDSLGRTCTRYILERETWVQSSGQ